MGLGASHHNTRSLTAPPYHAILQLKVLGGSFRPKAGIGAISGATRCRKAHSHEVAIRRESG